MVPARCDHYYHRHHGRVSTDMYTSLQMDGIRLSYVHNLRWIWTELICGERSPEVGNRKRIARESRAKWLNAIAWNQIVTLVLPACKRTITHQRSRTTTHDNLSGAIDDCVGWFSALFAHLLALLPLRRSGGTLFLP